MLETQEPIGAVRYIVAEDGTRTGVVLDWSTFQRLREQLERDPDLLPDLSDDELRALANALLAPAQQAQLDALRRAQDEGDLSAEDASEFDLLIEQIDSLNLIKARAMLTLQHREQA